LGLFLFYLKSLINRRVYLARKKRTNDLYAVKVLKKETMIQKNQVKHIQAERNILARTNNDFVIKMYYAFQSKVDRISFHLKKSRNTFILY
jgi:serine/threonine protein kinase